MFVACIIYDVFIYLLQAFSNVEKYYFNIRSRKYPNNIRILVAITIWRRIMSKIVQASHRRFKRQTR